MKENLMIVSTDDFETSDKHFNWTLVFSYSQGIKLQYILCLLFPPLHSDFDGNGTGHQVAITIFYDMLKPRGVLVIDHRNYDMIVAGKTPLFSYSSL